MPKFFYILLFFIVGKTFCQTTGILTIHLLGRQSDTVFIDEDSPLHQAKHINDSTLEFVRTLSQPECLFVMIDRQQHWWIRQWLGTDTLHKHLVIDYTKKSCSWRNGDAWDQVTNAAVTAEQQGLRARTDSIEFSYLSGHPDSYLALWFLSHGLYRNDRTKKLAALNLLAPNLQTAPEYKTIKADLMGRRYPKTGDPFLEFSLPGTNGTTFHSETVRNKRILLHFWSTGCGPCVREMDEIVRFYKTMDTSEVEFISVSLDEKISSWQTSKTTAKIIWPSVWQPGGGYGELCLNYNLVSMPFFIVFDKAKKIVAIRDGANELAGIKQLLSNTK